MLNQKIDTLKEKALTCEKFKDVWNYFLDNLSESTEFYDAGKVSSSKILTILLEVLRNEFFPNKKIKKLLIVELKNFNFIHGTCMISDRLVGFIFFKEINLAMFCLVRPGDDSTIFYRISYEEIEKGKPIPFQANDYTN
ncbi:MAG: hypothetical protein JNN15_11130 [Blastocatellia bacterium]|nr:hypothetical protein [Blastocatellia bacterium]